MAAVVRVGCTGWSYDDWRGGFYPRGCEPGDYLRRYARVFRFVEVDSSFYAAPRREQCARWVDATPDDFVFSLKLPRTITHDSQLDDDEATVEFLRALEPLRAAGKLGPLVAQLPPSFRREKHEKNLHAFLASWPRSARLAVELRHKSWWTDETYRALEDAGAALVWGTNETGRAPPRLTADWSYVRLVGDRALDETGGRWTHIQRDQTAEMEHWRDASQGKRTPDREWYWAVNNHLAGFAPESARRLAELLGEPPLDLERAMREPGQARLG